ncbi:hypothetical protein HYPSUDRAFT_424620 [Hypholoma sublateritium FD-334 SS-4]|uniref:C-CAP/cofactor C-like domain-containing protein n=1 Tax=Hypholoma sublateritium (strain FD-334 SS-4) TaxID=945553 RepID=A0A0D2MN38_HYPSF|nr:hypothetical protein HYPSUDRAFT_424620 [Hypholoma sublateritium FD-334 SS-4]
MDNSKWTFLQTFTPQFQAIASAKIEAAKLAPAPTQESFQDISVLLSKATKILADATGGIPTYDQRQYEIQLKAFERSIESLRASSAPKPKFAFKRKAPNPGAVATSTAQVAVAPTPTPAPEAPSSTSSNLVLSSQSHKYITRADLAAHAQQTDLSIFDLEHCVVDLLPPDASDAPDAKKHISISALHARNLTDCVLLLPTVEGSALLHDMTRCVIVVGCHQFRMHSSTKIDVLLAISSNPIIEDCKAIRFAQYPDIFKTPSERTQTLPTICVQDFSHIRATPSPNYSTMTDDDRVGLADALALAHRSRSSIDELSDVLLPK